MGGPKTLTVLALNSFSSLLLVKSCEKICYAIMRKKFQSNELAGKPLVSFSSAFTVTNYS